MVMTKARKVTCIRRKRGGLSRLGFRICESSLVSYQPAWVRRPPIRGVGGFRLHLFTEKFSKGMWQRL